MKSKIESGVLVIDAESATETEELKIWRAAWRAEPKKDVWFVCNYYNPIQTIAIDKEL